MLPVVSSEENFEAHEDHERESSVDEMSNYFDGDSDSSYETVIEVEKAKISGRANPLPLNEPGDNPIILHKISSRKNWLVCNKLNFMKE